MLIPIRKPEFVIMLMTVLLTSCVQQNNSKKGGENDEYDSPDLYMNMEFNRTKDPATGTVPRNRLLNTLSYTDSLKEILPFQLIAGYGNWTERGPNADVVGASNGNTRANSGVAAGRIRAIVVDAADATGNTVFIGGVNGGIWKTTNITASPATWTFVNDFFSNMAVTGICQNPATPATMYFCTGEWTFNGDAVGGDGIFKSTDGGASWTQLASTTGTNFDYCSKILCDAAGNVFVSTRTGVYRSIDGGTNWVTITPTGTGPRFSDMELSSTGRLHVSAGQFSTCAYRYTDNPSTVTAGTWTAAATGFPASTVRIELGCNGNTLYALPSNASYQVPTIYKSTDGGANWAATTGQPTAGWGSGQAWYNLAVDIDGSGNVIVGALEPYRSTDGGATWSRIGRWVGTTGQYVHADIHCIKMYGTNRVLFGCDGGIHYSSDGGTVIRDRNVGLRIKQFYSVAIHPSTTNYFLAGAQDNGVHQFNNAGLSTTTEVTGGDGGFVAIDQNNPIYQFGSYVFNDYRRSTNGGVSWSSVTLNSDGQFINPFDYDNTNFKIYAANTTTSYLRWDNPRTGNTTAVVTVALNNNVVSAVKVSPYTSNLVYMGTDDYNNGAYGGTCRLLKIANAHTATPTVTSIKSASMPGANVTVSCINTGTSDNNLIACFSNYGIQNVWVSADGGTNWTAIDGNLPDMPVRWCMFVPGDNTKAIIATEAGVYLTQLINGASTLWIPSPTFPTVRTDMLQYRPSDGLIATATHGRGIWTQPYLSIVPTNNFLLRGRWNGSNVALQWEYTALSAGSSLDVEFSDNGVNFNKAGSLAATAGTQYNYSHAPAVANVFYRIKSTEASGLVKYSNTVKLFKNGSGTGLAITSLYPNPARRDINFGFSTGKGKLTYIITATDGKQVMRKEEELQFTGNYIRTMDISAIAAGNYILTVLNGNEKASRQFLKK